MLIVWAAILADLKDSPTAKIGERRDGLFGLDLADASIVWQSLTSPSRRQDGTTPSRERQAGPGGRCPSRELRPERSTRVRSSVAAFFRHL